MKIKSLFSALAATLVVFAMSTSTLEATGNPQICLACAPSIGPITPTYNQNPNQCKWISFSAPSGMNGRCTRISYNWYTSDLAAQINFAGGLANIQFTQSGQVTVCVDFTVGFDRNGDGNITVDEQCYDTACTTVTVPC